LQLALFVDEDDPFTPQEIERKADELERTSTGKTVMKSLSEAYDAVYNRNIKKDDQRRQDAEKALKWVLCSFRRLTIEELLEAIAFTKNKKETHVTRDYLLKKICSNFIIEDHNGKAQFAHRSVMEYLEMRGENQERDEHGEYSQIEAHSQAAETCLVYLNDCDSHISSRTQGNGFHYAAMYWAEHCKMTTEKKRKEGYLGTLFRDFLLKRGNAKFAEWTNAVRERSDNDDDDAEDYYWFEYHPMGLKLINFTSIPLNPFFAACGWGFPEVVEQSLTTKGTDLSKLKEQINRGLHLASANGYPDIVKMLLEAEVKADIDMRTKNGWVALHLAAQNRHSDVMKLLLEANTDSDINVRTIKEGLTALHLAAQNGDTDAVTMLFEANQELDINAKDSDGRTALYIAAEYGHAKVVKMLCDARPKLDVNAEDSDGGRALRQAAMYGYAEVVRVLLVAATKVKINAKDSDGMTILNLASKNGHAEVVMLLLGSEMTDLNANDSTMGRTALHWATWNGHTKIVELLINAKMMDVNAQDRKGYTALHWATEKRRTKIVMLLLEREMKADINKQNTEGWTSLHLAALSGQAKIMKLLLTEAEVNKRNNQGRAALHYAARNGHINCVKMLLDKEADVKIQDKDGWTALHYAKEEGREEIVKLLLEAEPMAGA
jgi:ankyrin repeat protein